MAFGLGVDLIGVNVFQALAVSKKDCVVVFSNKFGKFLYQGFEGGIEVTEVTEIDEFEVLTLIESTKVPIIGFQFQKLPENFELFERVNILDIEKVGAWVRQNNNTTQRKVSPFYFSLPRVSVPKVK